MNTYYDDILSRIGEAPKWFDEHAVPRYEPFRPKLVADIYAEECCLLLIECQACGRSFEVALSWSAHARVLSHLSGRMQTLKLQITEQTIHYGDPPNVRCCPAGPTMNSVPIRVLEYWTRVGSTLTWTRDRALEIAITPDWATDRPDSPAAGVEPTNPP